MIVFDQITKQVAQAWLPLRQIVDVIPGFDWYLTYNTGAAFSFLADAGGWQRWFFTIATIIISAVIVFWIRRVPVNEKLTATDSKISKTEYNKKLNLDFEYLPSAIDTEKLDVAE